MTNEQHHMIFSPEECKTVIVLGAGASKHAGVPLLGEFREKLNKIIASTSSLTPEEQRILQDADCLFKRYCCPDGNVETLFSTISAGETLGSHQALDDRDTLSRAIAIVAELSLETQRSSSYAQLIRSIASKEKLNGDKALAVPARGSDTRGLIYAVPVLLLTFNWDSALDLEFSLGFPQEPNAIVLLSWLSGRERFSYDVAGEIDSRAGLRFVHCLRPHGSVTWGVCPECHRTRVFGHQEQDRHVLPFYTKITGTSCNWHTGECEPRLEPCIIAPTWDKRTDTPDLQGIWAATAQVLMQCENLLVIGFSLPPSDANVNSMFRFALCRNHSLQKVMVVDPSMESMENWRRLVNETQPALHSWEYVDQPFDENSLTRIEEWLQP